MRIENIGVLSENFRFYRCGSPNQKDFLINNGVEYVYSYRSNKTGRIVWVFVESEILSVLLTKWSENKPGGDCVGKYNET